MSLPIPKYCREALYIRIGLTKLLENNVDNDEHREDIEELLEFTTHLREDLEKELNSIPGAPSGNGIVADQIEDGSEALEKVQDLEEVATNYKSKNTDELEEALDNTRRVYQILNKEEGKMF